MISLLQKYAANGFADFAGLSISGQIPVKQELINEVIAEYLVNSSSSPSSSTAPPIDPKLLLSLLKKAEVHADAGVLTLHFEIKR